MTRNDVTPLDDPRLVEACLAGEQASWDALIERHGALVWAVAGRAGLSRADQADVFQNTWSTVLEELPRLRRPDRFAPWVARIARHQAMRVRRGYGIARRAMPKVAREDVDPVTPVEAVTEIEQRAVVHDALTRIGERCANLLRLLYFTVPQPAYDDIARTTGMRIGSIGPTRARCLERLRGTLGGSFEASTTGGPAGD